MIKDLLGSSVEHGAAVNILEKLLKTLKDNLKELPPSEYSNSLDDKMRETRMAEFKSMQTTLGSIQRKMLVTHFGLSGGQQLDKKQMAEMSNIMLKLDKHVTRIKSLCIEV